MFSKYFSRNTAIMFAVTLAIAIGAQAGILHHKKVKNPLADVNSKQPDKVLFDRAMDALNHGKFDTARITLQTLINTYPDSEYIARAKLGIGDAWYREGGTTALAQAEIEYKDFITFFPNLPEAAEAQLKVADIHYREMEKPDRDFTHAKRAEDEYRQLILQFPDSKLVPQAQQRLREVQEVCAEREYRIGRFYYMRESWPAAIARFQSLVDAYPLYSSADDALYLLGSAYEQEIDNTRRSKLPEVSKGRLIKDFSNKAAGAYALIVTRYPEMERASDAKRRLQALGRTVPTPTKEAIAQNKAEEASRSEMGRFSRIIGNFRHAPDTSHAAKVGEPTMQDPAETSAVAVVRQAGSDISGSSTVSAEVVGNGSDVTKSEAVPNSANAGPDSSEASSAPSGGSSATDNSGAGNSAPVSTMTPSGTSGSGESTGDTGIPELQPVAGGGVPNPAVQPTNTPSATPQTAEPQASSKASASGTVAPAAVPPPPQVNDATDSGSDSASSSAPKQDVSSSKKKRKKGLHKLIPF